MRGPTVAPQRCINRGGPMIQSTETQWLIDSLSTAVLWFDSDLRLCAINTAGEDLLSASARKIRGQSVEEMLPNDALTSAVRRSLATGQPFTEWDVELAGPGRDRVYVDCMVTPLTETHQEPGVLLEMVNCEGHRRILREEHILAQHNVTCSLVQGIAHEVKNPLGGIRGAAQLLERQLKGQSYTEYTQIIIDEVDRLRSLLDRMIGPSSLLRTETVNIHEVLERVRTLAAAEAPDTLALERDYDPSLPELQADRDQLIQALLNIVRNAVQALDGAGKVVLRTRSHRQFTIGAKLHKLVIRLDVIDNGPGIPPQIRKDVFYPMITGRADGTGLGLSIAQSLVHRQGGLIEFSSQPGETIFTVWLPVTLGNDQEK